MFRKASTALADPYPAPTVIPKAYAGDNAADYESELVSSLHNVSFACIDPASMAIQVVVIGKACKNVSEEDAMQYVAG